MNDDNLKQQIQSLSKDVADLKTEIEQLRSAYKHHKHEGDANDGSKRLEREIDLLPGQTVGAAGVGGISGEANPGGTNATRTILITGKDTTEADGLNNSQIYLEHQYFTDGTTNQSFYYAFRGPNFIGSNSGQFTSGGTVMIQTQLKWTPDQLVGATVDVENDDGTHSGYLITANDERSLTINGTFTSTMTTADFFIFVPIYLGDATRPWRRAYVTDGTAGGVRFGLGSTNAGQNGLLYMDAAGDLYWRDKAGISHILY